MRLVVLLEYCLIGVGHAVSDKHDCLVGLCSNLFCSIFFQYHESFSQGGGEVSDLHRFYVVDCLSKLSDILSGSLNQFRIPMFVCETLNKRSGFIREGKNCHKIVLSKSFHYVKNDMLCDLLP